MCGTDLIKKEMKMTLRALKSDAGDAEDAPHFRFGSALAAKFGRLGLPVVGPASAHL